MEQEYHKLKNINFGSGFPYICKKYCHDGCIPLISAQNRAAFHPEMSCSVVHGGAVSAVGARQGD
jgi:hypothetical protein